MPQTRGSVPHGERLLSSFSVTRVRETVVSARLKHGVPADVVTEEAHRVAASVTALNLKHAVVTSVTRDDLADGGASVFAETIREIRTLSPGTTVEVLIPDFQGSSEALEVVVDARPDVLNHNVETVPRLYPQSGKEPRTRVRLNS